MLQKHQVKTELVRLFLPINTISYHNPSANVDVNQLNRTLRAPSIRSEEQIIDIPSFHSTRNRCPYLMVDDENFDFLLKESEFYVQDYFRIPLLTVSSLIRAR